VHDGSWDASAAILPAMMWSLLQQRDMRSTVAAAADVAAVALQLLLLLPLEMWSCGSRWPAARASASTWSGDSTPACGQCSYSAAKRSRENKLVR